MTQNLGHMASKFQHNHRRHCQLLPATGLRTCLLPAQSSGWCVGLVETSSLTSDENMYRLLLRPFFALAVSEVLRTAITRPWHRLAVGKDVF